MVIKKLLIPVLCVTALIITEGAWAEDDASVKAVPQGTAAPLLDKRALDKLKLMSDTISRSKTVKFQARSMIPVNTPSGVWINLYETSRVVMQGPDKLFVGTGGDFAPIDLYFDGKAITRYSPDKNLYSVKDSPGTTDEMIETAYKEHGRSFPYADILISEPYARLTDDLISALYVGQSTLTPLSGQGSIKTDHLVFANKEVQWQVWMGLDDHLPRLAVATYLDDASEESYTVEFGDWKLNESVDASAFVFNNTSNAVKVEFRDPAPEDEDSVDDADEKGAEGGRS